MITELFGYASISLFLGTIIYYPTAKLFLKRKHIKNYMIIIVSLAIAVTIVANFIRINIY